MSTWTTSLPPQWQAVRPSVIFQERREASAGDDEHLTPSQHHGVLTQADYMRRTGTKVVLNLTAPDNMKHVEPDDFIAHLRSFQGGLEKSNLRGKVSTAYTVIKPRAAAEPNFFRWVLKSPAFIGELAASCEQLRDGQSVKFSDFARILLPLPPQEEQRRIADFLDDRVARIDNIISARRTQLALASTALVRVLMDLLLSGGLRQLDQAPWFSTDGTVSIIKLSSQWRVIDCKHRTPSYIDSGYPVISPGDIVRARLDLSRATRFVGHEDLMDLADEPRRCRPGDLVYSRNASAGIAAYVDTTEPFTMGQDVCRITSDSDDQLYLAYCLNFLMTPQLDRVRIGATFTRINVAQIKSLAIPYRSVHEQQKVAALCDRAVSEGHAKIGHLERSVALLLEYKESLITAAVTGELDVTTAGSGIPR